MKDLLNDMKRREPYRPVSPICLRDRSAEIFDPGGHDPTCCSTTASGPSGSPASRPSSTSTAPPGSRPWTPRPVPSSPNCSPPTSGSAAFRCCATPAPTSTAGLLPGADAALRWGRARLVWAEGSLYERKAEGEHA
ncbi:hypothetical protein NKH77_44445 [Streptomyces sp. M19]